MLHLAYSLADQNHASTKSIGIFNLATQLAGALSRHPGVSQLSILANRTLGPLIDGLPHTRVHPHNLPLRGKWGRLLWDHWAVYHAARRTGAPWLLLPKGFASILRRCPTRLACYVHDIVPHYYLEQGLGNPWSPELRLFQASLRATLRKASVIFTNSNFTRAELQRLAAFPYPRPPRIVVAGIGFDPGAWSPQPKQDALVALVSPWPHKRTPLLLTHLQRWHQASQPGRRVHLIGRLPAGCPAPSHPGWVLHPRLDDAAYRALVGEARALVYFTDYEGFGMPPVEALAAGACPAFSDIPATREVMQAAGCPFNNEDFGSFARALDEAMGMPADRVQTWRSAVLGRLAWPAVADRVVSTLLAEPQEPA